MHSKFGQKIINKIRGGARKNSDRQNKHFDLNFKIDEFGENAEFVDTKGTFYEFYQKHKGYLSNKWEQYFHIYNKILAPLKNENKPLKLLEVGVQNGGSLQLWGEYLPHGSEITGIDIDERCADLKFNDNIKVFIGSASDSNFIAKEFSNSKFDVIIDDGSHICDDVIKTFEQFFPKLNYGGLYVVEDCHTSYWHNCYKGGFRTKGSTMEYFKGILDCLNLNYIKKFPRTFKEQDEKKLVYLNKEIASITFFDSVIVIEKYTKPKNRTFKNYYTNGEAITGNLEDIKNAGNILCDERTKFEKFFR